MNFNFNTKPELLAPAGSFDCLKAAIQNGADAVYLGLKTGSARMGADNFSFDELKEALSYAHIRGVKVYLALNTLISDNEFATAYSMAQKADSLGIDALILQDLGLATKILKNKNLFNCEIHASTQMSVYNKEGVAHLKSMGFDRCITARELSINELSEICNEKALDIEVFCHGALCMSMSGQCLLSSFIGSTHSTCGSTHSSDSNKCADTRSGNRGTCAQPCRQKYSLTSNGKDSSPAYRLSPADFAALPYIKELIATGIHSLKIEGRLKSASYVACVTRSYREAIDKAYSSRPQNTEKNLRDMQVLFGRGSFTSGYLKGKLPFKDITFISAGRTGLPIGTTKGFPIKLPSPKSLPKKLTRFCLTATINKEAQLSVGDGITVYTLTGGEQTILCGGTVNSIEQNGKGNLAKIIAVGRINNLDSSNPEGILTITDDAHLRDSIEKNLHFEQKKVPVSMRFEGRVGVFPLLEIFDNFGNKTLTKGPAVLQTAQHAPTCSEDIKKQLTKTGDTPFIIENIKIDIEDNIFIPISAINAMRREGLAQLTEKRTAPINKKATRQDFNFCRQQIFAPQNLHGGISLFFYTTDGFLSFEDKNYPELLRPYSKETGTYYVPLSLFAPSNQATESFAAAINKMRTIKSSGNKIFAVLPYINLGAAKAMTKKCVEFVCNNYLTSLIDGFMCENLGDFEILKNTGAAICCDYSMNITNRHSLKFLEQNGVSRATLSVEANLIDRLCEVSDNNIASEIIIGGPIVLMRSRHCYIDEGECNGKKSKCLKAMYSLKDSHGCVFPILPQKEDCCSILLSHKPVTYSIGDIKKLRNINPKATLRVNIF